MKEKELYKYYELTLKIRDRIIGGIPKNPKVIQRWIQTAMQKADKVKREEIIKETVEAMGEDAEAEKSWTGFKSDTEKGLYIEGRQVKAMLKEGANVIKKAIGIANFKSKLAERIFVYGTEDPNKIFLGVMEPTGYEEKPGQVMTMRGPRSILQRYDYVEKPIIKCHLRVLNDNLIKQNILENLLEYCCENGIGAKRSQGEGVILGYSLKTVKKPEIIPTHKLE